MKRRRWTFFPATIRNFATPIKIVLTFMLFDMFYRQVCSLLHTKRILFRVKLLFLNNPENDMSFSLAPVRVKEPNESERLIRAILGSFITEDHEGNFTREYARSGKGNSLRGIPSLTTSTTLVNTSVAR
jgi:hypothetical protein